MSVAREIVLLGVPIDSVGIPEPGDPPFGTERAPSALRSAGLAEAVGAADLGDLDMRLVRRVRDEEAGVLGWPSVLAMTGVLRGRIGDAVAERRMPLVLGGDCALLPGALAGARDALGDLGLAYLDGHLDLYDGQTSPTGEAADMPVAVLTGIGPYAWSEEVGAPLVSPERIAMLGPRDRVEAAVLGSALPEQLGIPPELSPTDLRARGMTAAGEDARVRLAGADGRYWVHLDVDVLDERVFPATDYLMSGGLVLGELNDLMRPLTTGSGLAGLSVGCYNPGKDPEGSGARSLVGLLRDLLG